MKAVLGLIESDPRTFGVSLKDLKAALQVVDKRLNLRNYLVGYQMTIADVVLAVHLILPFQLLLDQGSAKEMPNVARFVKIMSENPAFVRVFGRVQFTKKAMVPNFNQKPQQKEQNKEKGKQPQQ